MARQAMPLHLPPPDHFKAPDPAPQLKPARTRERAVEEAEEEEDRLLAKRMTVLPDVEGEQGLSRKRLAMPVAMPDRR